MNAGAVQTKATVAHLQIEVAVRNIAALVHHLNNQIAVRRCDSDAVAKSGACLVISIRADAKINTLPSCRQEAGFALLHADAARSPVDALV